MESWQHHIRLNATDSTNSYCADILKKTYYPEGTIISTLYQNKGRGLAQNQWESEKGKNILLSLILYPDFLPIDKQFLLSKVVSLGLANYAQAKTSQIKIKWPNDIYYKDKKIAGILIENTIKGSRLNQSIIGIGFNLNQEDFVSDAPNPISLTQITKKKYSIDQEIVKIRKNIRFFYDKLKAGKIDEINNNYLKCMYRFNEFKPFKYNNETQNAKITGVNEFGHLIIETEKGEQKEFDLKEIEFVI